MEQMIDFSSWFRSLWSEDPFPWQHMLAERVVNGSWPHVLELPTAAGKTACIDIAIYALAVQAETPVSKRTAPRRIWFVVDRRIVVDEAFERARTIAEKLTSATRGPLKVVSDRLRAVGGTGRPLAVGRLRGGILRDDGWARLPSQPALITSTVDQFGSRLLFRGYGRGALAAPIFAGLAAHDSLVILDEAHLSVPFLQTLRSVERLRGDKWAEQPIRTPFAFSILSATPPEDAPKDIVFPGDAAERDAALDDPELKRRIATSKPAELVLVRTTRNAQNDPVATTAAEYAARFVRQDNCVRVAVIVNRVRTAEDIERVLHVQHGDEIDIILLTGRLRPFERDRLVARYKPYLQANQPKQLARPMILVTTQCIEVGADFSFDGLVTEVASLDALRQRFGRLNRLGRLATVSAAVLAREQDVEHEASDPVYGTALPQCWHLLQEIAAKQGYGESGKLVVDFGIAALDQHLRTLDVLSPYLAPSPYAPMLLPAHVDLLCQTSPRPEVEPDIHLYLHGVGRGQADVGVVWRTDLEEGDVDSWPEIVALCPPNSGETSRLPLYRLRRWLSHKPDDSSDSDVEGVSSPDEAATNEHIRPVLLWRGRDRSRVCTRASDILPNDVVVLPASYGMNQLAQSAPDQFLGSEQLDIWEPSHGQGGKQPAVRIHRKVLAPWMVVPPVRALVEQAEDPSGDRDLVQQAIDGVLAYQRERQDDPGVLPDWWVELLEKCRGGHYDQHPGRTRGLILRSRQGIGLTGKDVEEDFFADDDDLFSATGQAVGLDMHAVLVERAVDNLAGRCLPQEVHEPLRTAAYWHDVGKLDERFQLMLRQGDELAVVTEPPLAKSVALPLTPVGRRLLRAAGGPPQNFRHEMLSAQLAELVFAADESQESLDLAVHTIASHHGHARPFAPICPDPEPPPIQGAHGGIDIDVSTEDRAAWPVPHTLASGVSERFWRLTRRYGWWGLAYLEAVLRLGDWYASRFTSEQAPEIRPSALQQASTRVLGAASHPVVLEGIHGANPLGFLAAIGTLVVLHEAGYRESRLGWRRDGIIWRPFLAGVRTKDLPAVLAEDMKAMPAPPELEQKLREVEKRLARTRKQINDKKKDIRERSLRGKERKTLLEDELEPLENELRRLGEARFEILRRTVSRPELALGNNIDCTELEYRRIAEPLLQYGHCDDRGALDMLAAFCSPGCLRGSQRRTEAKLAPTPFAFISGSGHQDFLDTVRHLMRCVTPERVESTLFHPWTYEDEGLSLRWDPVEDRRHALMDRDPTADDNKPRTVWMANLLAYRALVLFPSVPTQHGLETVGWMRDNYNNWVFTWPLWDHPLEPDSIRSLLLLSDLYLPKPDRVSLQARGVRDVFRSVRIKVGSAGHVKFNFTPGREV